MSGQAYAAGGIRTTVAATRAATDDELRANLARLAARAAARRASRRSRPSRATASTSRTSSGRCASLARSTPETTFLGAHVVPDGVDRARLRRPRLRRDARGLRALGPLGGRLLRGRRVRRRRDARTSSRPAWRQVWSRGCTPTSSTESEGVQIAVELGAASADHCTHLTAADIDALAAVGHCRDAAAARRVLDPLPLPAARGPARRGRDRRHRHRLQPGIGFSTADAAGDRARGAGDAHDPGRGASGPPPSAGQARCGATTSAGSVSARAPTSSCWTRRAISTSPTGRACRSSARSGATAAASPDPQPAQLTPGPVLGRTCSRQRPCHLPAEPASS